jgi:hypothetical protein
MSLVSLRKCPVSYCKFNHNPVFADLSQIKRHLKYDHDYKEKQFTAFSIGLTNTSDEKHSPTWFVNSLINFTKIEDRS